MKRIFIAIDINKNKILTRLIESFKLMLKDEKIRWVNPENMHLTLAFLGDNDDENINKVVEIINKTVPEYNSFEISFKSLGVFKNIRQPQVIWIGIEAPESLYDLREKICAELKESGLYQDKKPFRPHLTLGRMKYLTSRDALSDILKSSGIHDLPAQIVNEIILYESILKAHGPVYKPLETTRLKESVH